VCCLVRCLEQCDLCVSQRIRRAGYREGWVGRVASARALTLSTVDEKAQPSLPSPQQYAHPIRTGEAGSVVPKSTYGVP